jgi:3-dehydroquinate synthase
MHYLQQTFLVRFEYNVFFTTSLFDISNQLMGDFLKGRAEEETIQKIMFVVDEGVAFHHPTLAEKIRTYFSTHTATKLVEEILFVPGGEAAKNDPALFNRIVEAVNHHGIDRHSYLAAIGGGSVLDLAGYAAAVSHRGIKHIRIPTTVLSQNDSGVGVKNGINYKNKKNFLGTFAPPVAVFNDDRFLATLSDREWRSGISEAVKVALIKDAAFFGWLEEHAGSLISRNTESMNYLVKRCAELHMQHIAGGDPFESGSSRPLDFGHWSAHKLEQLTDFDMKHGEAVAAGIALDSVYAVLCGLLPREAGQRIISLLQQLGFAIFHPQMEITGENSPILAGLQEFREHLGGRLTIMLLKDIGIGEEVHHINLDVLKQAAGLLKELHKGLPLSSLTDSR